jgi:hypothetical protein
MNRVAANPIDDHHREYWLIESSTAGDLVLGLGTVVLALV